MAKRNAQILTFLIVSLSMMLVYQNCAPSHDSASSASLGSQDGGPASSGFWSANADLESEAFLILDKHCASCHAEGSVGSGNVTDILNLDYLIESKLIVPGQPKQGSLINSVVNGSMPITGKLNDEEIIALQDWLESFELYEE